MLLGLPTSLQILATRQNSSSTWAHLTDLCLLSPSISGSSTRHTPQPERQAVARTAQSYGTMSAAHCHTPDRILLNALPWARGATRAVAQTCWWAEQAGSAGRVLTERQVSAILCQQHSPQAPCGFPLFELAMCSAEVIICVREAPLALGKFHNNTSPKTQYRCTIFNAPVPEPNFKNWHHYSSSTNCFNGAQCGRLLLTPHEAWIIQISSILYVFTGYIPASRYLIPLYPCSGSLSSQWLHHHYYINNNITIIDTSLKIIRLSEIM